VQGAIETLKVSAEAIKTAYAALPAIANDVVRLVQGTAPKLDRATDKIVSEGAKVGMAYAAWKWLRNSRGGRRPV
jgi:hypothetical protein